MFKFSRRLVADLRFWRKEMRLRAEENEEWEKIEAEALKLHKEQKSAMK